MFFIEIGFEGHPKDAASFPHMAMPPEGIAAEERHCVEIEETEVVPLIFRAWLICNNEQLQR